MQETLTIGVEVIKQLLHQHIDELTKLNNLRCQSSFQTPIGYRRNNL